MHFIPEAARGDVDGSDVRPCARTAQLATARVAGRRTPARTRLALFAAAAALFGGTTVAPGPAAGQPLDTTPRDDVAQSSVPPGGEDFVPVRTCAGKLATIVHPGDGNPLTGTPGSDVILGSAANDLILGGGGNDVICGAGGIDGIDGGNGNDLLRGGPGDDALYGMNGADTLLGEDGQDTLLGGAGIDYHDGGVENDWLYADLYDDGSYDMVFGGPGNDHLRTRDGVGNDVGNSGGGYDGCRVDGSDDVVGCHYWE
jgi:hypothetical protein